MLHKFANVVAACTVCLILAGSLVTSTGSGLSVPDWPTTYGWNMFTFPFSKWVGGILYEHGHRLIATAVGALTIVLAAWLWLAAPRRPLRWLGVAALGTVVAQGVLGGITVLFFLPTAISTAHAALAEVFFCLTVTIALLTSPGWNRDSQRAGVDDAMLRLTATATTAIVFVQIVVGAVMRHSGAGLAIPDFPLVFGGLLPARWSPAIAINFAHRAGALIVAAAVAATAAHIWHHHPGRRELTRPAALACALLALQVTLGAFTIWTGRRVWVNSAHVVGGALVLTTVLVIALRSWQARITGRGAAARAACARAADPCVAAAINGRTIA